MGTNYYLKLDNPEDVDVRLIDEDSNGRISLGKSSAGWNFKLRVYPECDVMNLNDVIEKVLSLGCIYNEYGDNLSVSEFLDIVTNRKCDGGLRKHNVNGHFCIGNGSGTYDYCIGDFS